MFYHIFYLTGIKGFIQAYVIVIDKESSTRSEKKDNCFNFFNLGQEKVIWRKNIKVLFSNKLKSTMIVKDRIF